AREIQDLADRGRAGTLSRAELTGSTFTITSLGALGGVLATPILNYPEVAILGIHKIQRRPVYRPDGSIGPADMMNLSISLDHRVVDGFEGAQFVEGQIVPRGPAPALRRARMTSPNPVEPLPYETAAVEETLGPGWAELLRTAYRWMVLGRTIDAHLQVLQRQGRLDFLGAAPGHEAVNVAA